MSEINATFQKIRRSQAGTVSIMTTMVLMIVISLIVLGFAQISRRNQKQSLDRQLSTQAFYAAESGVNDVHELIKNAVAAGTAIPDKTSCSDLGTGGFYGSLNPDIDVAKNIKYTCVIVDPSPTQLRYSDVGTTSTIIPMNSATGAAFSKINITLQSKLVGGSPISGCPSSTASAFKTSGSWGCGYGVLRFDLVPTSGGSLNSDSLRTSAMTTFAVPFAAGGLASIPYVGGVTNANNLMGMRCNNTNCTLSITGLSQNSYYMRVTSLYRDMAMQVTADSAGGPIQIAGAQAVVDSTGRAQDVLRRIQVNIPLRNTSRNELSDYAIQSTDAICKRYAVMQGFFDTSVTGVTSANPLCQP